MLNTLFASRTAAPWLHVVARLCSVGQIFQSLSLIILIVYVTLTDPITPPVTPEGVRILAGVGLALLGAVLVWRWQRLGAVLLLLGAGTLAVGTAISAIAFDIGWLGLALLWIIYPLLPFTTGVLSLASNRTAAQT